MNQKSPRSVTAGGFFCLAHSFGCLGSEVVAVAALRVSGIMAGGHGAAQQT